jgi:hypothetical protein
MRTMRIAVVQAMLPWLVFGAAGVMSGCGSESAGPTEVIKQPPPEVGGKDSMDYYKAKYLSKKKK